MIFVTLIFVYLKIPCPYIRMWDQNGNLIEINQLMEILSSFLDSMKTNLDFTNISENKNQNILDFMIIDEHPLTGKPYISMHTCGFKELISKISKNSVNDDNDINDNNMISFVEDNNCRNDHNNNYESPSLDVMANPLYMLNWFTIIGPYIGFLITPDFYCMAKEILLCSQL